MKENGGVVFTSLTRRPDNMDLIFTRQALANLFEHPRIGYGFQNRGEDYSSFFYFLHAYLNLR